MTISASMVKELREKTSAGMLDCKKALEESNGDFDKAVEWLRTKGITKAGKKSGRITAEGLVHAYIHGEGRIGVLLEVNSETDFVARNEEFQSFTKDIALHIAAMAPQYVHIEEIPESARENEARILKARALEEGKKAEFLDKIIAGQLQKWAAEICLLDQKFIKNPDKTVGEFLKETIAKIGENIVIRRFVRYELGEGLEKKQEDFAAEVAKQIQG
ncbi:MAG: translation elongation factor Ts [Pseudobdellovibrionaceae bacterium]|nr:translation elongation factor Ts [Bdellovibrionales bacterium]USN46756.1 MAG: translation elongation factor Ts [Pseudobdellovibrionaceae bacterium]